MAGIPILNILLFCITCLTTLTAGALLNGVNLLEDPAGIVTGFPFAGALMTILLCHEFGHYFAARRHNTLATLPYFIPAPPIPPLVIGTFGAFIKMKSPIMTRAALIDIGASGPVSGFLVSLAACIVGLALSPLIPLDQAEGMFSLGDSLLFTMLSWAVFGTLPPNTDILLHPVAFAGWIGLFITAMNLIPIGQLDGGHILYALLGKRHETVSAVLVGVLGALGTAAFLWEIGWPGWGVWAVLMLILGIDHPPVAHWEERLDPGRRFLGVFAIIIFILTFVPSPIRFMGE
jgi:membrane-associated protease RseP (regulator of RpoE activity)